MLWKNKSQEAISKVQRTREQQVYTKVLMQGLGKLHFFFKKTLLPFAAESKLYPIQSHLIKECLSLSMLAKHHSSKCSASELESIGDNMYQIT